MIVTLALYALLLTINGLAVFLNDWARRGDVVRIGLLESVNSVSGHEGFLPLVLPSMCVCVCSTSSKIYC